MLWTSAEDISLWDCIKAKGVKRESRIASDNSEDAVTWNVFRYLEVSGRIGEFVDSLTGDRSSQNAQVIYWSYCQSNRKPYPPLLAAAATFGEHVARRSEPDVILEDESNLVFIECKFGSGNRTQPSDPENQKLYLSGGDGWFGSVFNPDVTFATIAVQNRLYELMRLWILGSWIASQKRKRFFLVNLVRDNAIGEANIESRFTPLTLKNTQRNFVRYTWEQVFIRFILPDVSVSDAAKVAEYLQQKTMGYSLTSKGRQGKLRKAFTLHP